MLVLLAALLAAPHVARAAPATAPVSPRLAARVASSSPADSIVVWAFLRFNAPDASPAISPRALLRRAQRAPHSLGDPTDAPIDPADVRALEGTGLMPRVTSRWLRAVSGTIAARDVARLAALPIVQRLDLVRARRAIAPPAPEQWFARDRRGLRLHATGEMTDAQLAQIQVDSLHARGFRGAGMVIGMLDTGFNPRHQALSHATVLATRDVVHGDWVVENEPTDDPREDDHGTETWGIIAGDAPGTYTGGASEASFVLAKTEELLVEERVEEDFWVTGLEWADSLGADVVSSSLVYNFVGTDSPYVYADLDGDTAPSTIAADAAVARGLVVVNAMGNDGATAWRYMSVPADGDGVLSIGAVDTLGVRAAFSSVGPTADGRIKPDLVALGVHTAVLNPNDSLGYGFGGGTSFSTPLVASLCALLLEAHPTWSPGNLRDALRLTASQASAPDTLVGWGIPRGAAAGDYFASHVGGEEPEEGSVSLNVAGAEPARSAVTLRVRCSGACEPMVSVYDGRGRLVARPPLRGRWNLRDLDGRVLPSGVYVIVASAGADRVSRRVVIAR